MRAQVHVQSRSFPAHRRKQLRERLLRWYTRHARTLPWRDIDNPYYVLVSEFMLQQTQVARVLEHFPRWVGRFPDINALAAATRRQVLLAWSGMGYNRRALHLHEAARMVRDEYGGTLPSDPAELQKLPGVGRYTASAIACFGFRKRHAVVDVNIRRVLSRLSENMGNSSHMLPEPLIWQTAALLLPERAYYNWNQALMDLGATICTARVPSCDQCPLTTQCPSSGKLEEKAPAERNVLRETPRRIYRGRIIELLRQAKGHCMSAATLGEKTFAGETTPAGTAGATREADLRPRLLDILATLQRDGMIRARRGRRQVTDLRAYAEGLEDLKICMTD
ncbi:A/G-specific adenine glycosylase [bacterium]|nr:A/G-specific adenine glycosylase [bacterium]